MLVYTYLKRIVYSILSLSEAKRCIYVCIQVKFTTAFIILLWVFKALQCYSYDDVTNLLINIHYVVKDITPQILILRILDKNKGTCTRRFTDITTRAYVLLSKFILLLLFWSILLLVLLKKTIEKDFSMIYKICALFHTVLSMVLRM